MFISIQISKPLGRPIVPWSIVEVNDTDKTFLSLFEAIKGGSFDVIPVTEELKTAILSQTYIGPKQDELMLVSSSQCVKVCCQFGIYLRFRVESPSTDAESSTLATPCPNAFTVLTAAQRRLQMGDDGLPHRKTVKDGMDRLYNDILSLLKEMGVRWNSPLMYGAPFVQKLQDILWYIDGHHDSIKEKASKIPPLFKRFVGYNCPERHKHRKRTQANLSRSEINGHVLSLQSYLQSSWFKKEVFSQLKEATEMLMGSLNQYVAYLVEKNKSMKLHHESTSPSATPCDSSDLRYMPKISTVSSNIWPLQEKVIQSDPYTPIPVMDFTPSDRKQRYR